MGWHVKPLREITSKIGSGATPRGGASSYKSEGISLVRSMNVHDRKFVKNKLAFIDNEQAKKLANVTLEPHDVLLNITGASVARCCVIPQEILPARVNQHVSILRVHKETVLPKFLCYALTSKVLKETLLRIGEEGGSTRQAITKAQLQELEISFPSLEEQKLIVAILDEAFAGLDRARGHTDANLQNARDLFESALGECFDSVKSSGIHFEDICEDTQIGLVRNAKSQSHAHPTPYIKMNNIGELGRFVDVQFSRVECDSSEIKKYQLVKGDFLFNTRNSYELVGKSCLYEASWEEPSVFNNNVMRVRFREGINSKYVRYAFQTEDVRAGLEKIKSGTTNVVGIYHKSLKNLLVPIVKHKEQLAIVRKLSEIENQSILLLGKYQSKLTDLDDLRQSLLQKAFAGELT